MKKLDWKSLAIGVLLTTTVMFGTGAATSTTEKWDSQQKWEIIAHGHKEKCPMGYEPIGMGSGAGFGRYFGTDLQVICRKRIQ